MTDLRNYVLRLNGSTDLLTETCFKCGVLFAMTEDFQENLRRNRNTFYCPNGHGQVYTGKTDAQKLKDAEARETALNDQLFAAVADAEKTRGDLIRARIRIANGVCPCCNRSFENVRRHIATKHPDYNPGKLTGKPVAKCGCGRTFETVQGLHNHQTRQRGRDWWKPSKPHWSSHLTVV